MDTFILILFMAIFYLGPALLKKYREKTTQSPQSPVLETINEPIHIVPDHIKSVTVVDSTMAVDKMQSVPTIVEERSAWHGKLEHNMITNGVIFGEILQPPRAYRPFVRR